MSIDTIYIYIYIWIQNWEQNKRQTKSNKHRNIVRHPETLWNTVKHANIRKTPRLNLSAKETCDFLHPAHTLLDLRSSFDLFCLYVSGTNTIKMYAESCRTLNLVESHISYPGGHQMMTIGLQLIHLLQECLMCFIPNSGVDRFILLHVTSCPEFRKHSNSATLQLHLHWSLPALTLQCSFHLYPG